MLVQERWFEALEVLIIAEFCGLVFLKFRSLN